VQHHSLTAGHDHGQYVRDAENTGRDDIGELTSARPARRAWRTPTAAGMTHPLRMIGFLGTGRMGMPMCANLVRAGHTVIAHDLRPELEAEARACGAQWAATASGAAGTADVLITMLPGPREVTEAMVGPGDALRALRAGSTWIDMSSNATASAEPIRAQARERGVDVLEAPVGGGVAAARKGELTFFVGGSAEVLDRHRRVFEALGDPERTVHVGGPGTGYTTKLLVNLLWFGQAVATAEALLLGKRAGIDLGVLRGALAGSAAATRFIRNDLDALFDGDYMTSFGLDRCCEELENVVAQAREYGVPFELSSLVERVHRRALARFGPVDGELMAVALLEEEAGSTLR
jgi:3-hydroxyisobutyrate dehydrogenase